MAKMAQIETIFVIFPEHTKVFFFSQQFSVMFGKEIKEDNRFDNNF